MVHKSRISMNTRQLSRLGYILLGMFIVFVPRWYMESAIEVPYSSSVCSWVDVCAVFLTVAFVTYELRWMPAE